MKLRNKILSTLLASSMLVSIPVLAEETQFTTIHTETITINEFDNVVNAKSSEMYDVAIQSLEERASLSDQQLLELGYTSDQILTLREFMNSYTTGQRSDVDLTDVGSDMTLEFSIAESTQSARVGDVTGDVNPDAEIGGEEYRVYIDWQWDEQPFWTFEEILGIGWGAIGQDGNEAPLELIQRDSYHDVTYVHPVYSSETVDVGIDLVEEWVAAESIWDITKGSYGKFAQRGEACIALENTGRSPVDRFKITTKYGHSYLAVSPSVAWNGGTSLSVGISLTGAVDTKWSFSDAFDYWGRP